jgi:redox-sensitive bicupin YhaK (pirin superfamily)
MLTRPRGVQQIVTPVTTSDGAGVVLQRSIATHTLDHVDPFLLFDHFGSDNPDDYIAGFPMHPHRGIETVTYMLAGVVHHRDSTGRTGTIAAGDVQWMTAGRGIMHEEMPARQDGEMGGFQLWVNLPARLKMTAPRYQEVPSAAVPQVERPDGSRIRVVAGTVDGVQGAITEIAADPTYLDVRVPAGRTFAHAVAPGHTALAYVFEGAARFGESAEVVAQPKLVIFTDGDGVIAHTAEQPVRFLLISGQPLGEPIARWGPFVMNTRAEIEQTLREIRDGTFAR